MNPASSTTTEEKSRWFNMKNGWKRDIRNTSALEANYVAAQGKARKKVERNWETLLEAEVLLRNCLTSISLSFLLKGPFYSPSQSFPSHRQISAGLGRISLVEVFARKVLNHNKGIVLFTNPSFMYRKTKIFFKSSVSRIPKEFTRSCL